MFFPKAMSEIELIVPAADLVRVTKVLGGKGVFHQVETGGIGGDRERQRADGWTESATAYAALERRVQALIQTLGVEIQSIHTAAATDLVDLDGAKTEVETIEQEVRSVAERIAQVSKSLDTLRAHKHQLETIVDVDLDIKMVQESKYLLSMLGTMPAANVGRLQSSLARVPHMLLTMREDPHRPVVWLGGTTSNRDVFERATRSAYFEALVLPTGYEGPPRQVIEWIDSEAAKAERELIEQREILRALAQKHAGALSQLAWEVHASRSLTEAILKFGRLRHTYVIVGWAPTRFTC